MLPNALAVFRVPVLAAAICFSAYSQGRPEPASLIAAQRELMGHSLYGRRVARLGLDASAQW
jgi:hypothetical protein